MSAPVLLLTIPTMHMQYFISVDAFIRVEEIIQLCNQYLNKEDYFYALYDVCDQCLLDPKALMDSLIQEGVKHVMLI